MPKVSVVSLPAETVQAPKTPPAAARPARKIPWRAVFAGLRRICLMLVSRDSLAINMLAFLLSRVSIMGELAPFGLALFAAVAQVAPERALAVGLWAIVGVLTAGNTAEMGVYILSIAMYYRFAGKLTRQHKKLLAVPMLMFVTVALGGMAFNMWQQMTLYNVVLMLFDGAICAVLACIFVYGVPFMLIHTIKRQAVGDALVCALVLLAAAVAGIGSMSILGYSVRNMAGSLLIMALAVSGGAGLGTSAGVAIGLVIGLTGGWNASLAISMYALAGLLAGTFRSLGKFAVVIGFMLGCTIALLYLGQTSELTQMLTEGAVAAAVIMVIPAARLKVWSQGLQEGREVASSEPLVAAAVDKLKNISDIFSDLAGAFGTTAAGVTDKARKDELSQMIAAVGEQVCEQCGSRPECWERDFYRTYNALLEVFGTAENVSITAANMPKALKEHCRNIKEVAEYVNFISERKRAYAYWQKKLADSRQMVMEQMKATSTIVVNLAHEIRKQPVLDKEFALTLQEKAALLDCSLEDVRVTGTDGAATVEVSKQPCTGNQECKNTLLPLTAKLMQEKMTLHAQCGNAQRRKPCQLTMKVVTRYRVETGAASIAKEEQDVSGDTYAVVPLNKGKVALMISDGMGSGTRAAGESAMAVRFLEKLLAVGFDVDVAVKTVNSMLMLSMPDESFATVDMAIIDTYSGDIEFLKIGSAPSFVKRVREVSTIQSASLPIGILHQIEIDPVKAQLVPGDIIVMVSDGIIDAAPNGLERDNWVANYLRRLGSSNPQEIADRLLAEAMALAGPDKRDDMTVLVSKIVEQPARLH